MTTHSNATCARGDMHPPHWDTTNARNCIGVSEWTAPERLSAIPFGDQVEVCVNTASRLVGTIAARHFARLIIAAADKVDAAVREAS